MDRKLKNLQDQLSQQNKDLMSQLQSLKPAASKAESKDSEEDISDLIYTNPKEAIKRIQEQTKQAVLGEVNQATTRSTAVNSTIANLTREYPELSDDSSELTRKAIELYKNYGDESPIAVRAAIREAAAELGVMPMSKRSNKNADDFSVGSSSASTSQRTAKKSELSEDTITWAKLLGRDPDKDPEIKKRLEEKSKRKSYNRYG